MILSGGSRVLIAMSIVTAAVVLKVKGLYVIDAQLVFISSAWTHRWSRMKRLLESGFATNAQ